VGSKRQLVPDHHPRRQDRPLSEGKAMPTRASRPATLLPQARDRAVNELELAMQADLTHPWSPGARSGGNRGVAA